MADKFMPVRPRSEHAKSTPAAVSWQEPVTNAALTAELSLEGLSRVGESSREQRVLDLQHALGNHAVEHLLAQRIEGASRHGDYLEPAVRQWLQNSLGADLSGVRVHTDDEADELSRAVQATAFATGQEIFFRRGAYQPATAGGRWLIAHEAAHTLQQANRSISTLTSDTVALGESGDRAEQEAESVANQASVGETVHVETASPPMISRSIWDMIGLDDIDAFIENIESAARSETFFELPGQNPKTGGGFQGNVSKQNPNPNQIAYSENHYFTDVGDVKIAEGADVPIGGERAPGASVIPENVGQVAQPVPQTTLTDAGGQPVINQGGQPAGAQNVEVRYHSTNPAHPAQGPTVQVNTPQDRFGWLGDKSIDVAGQQGHYLLPDGTWKPISAMTPAERAAAHWPTGHTPPGSGGGTPPPATLPPSSPPPAPTAHPPGGGASQAVTPLAESLPSAAPSAAAAEQTALVALEQAAPSGESALASTADDLTPATKSGGGTLGKILGGANYGLQFLGNMMSGQDLGESAFGAAAGGYVGNRVSGGGWDTAINLANAGLQLLGAPKEITGYTQMAADATPSGFATSVASNAGRGLWNLGEGLFSGDWSGIQKQGQDILHGKSGSALQGWGMMTDLVTGGDTNWMTGEAAKRGDYGFAVQLGNQIGDDWYDLTEQYGGFGGVFKEFGSELGSFLWEGATGKGGIKGAANWVGDQASDAWDWTKGAVSDAGSAIAGAAESAYDWASDTASDVGSAIGGAASDAWDWLAGDDDTPLWSEEMIAKLKAMED